MLLQYYSVCLFHHRAVGEESRLRPTEQPEATSVWDLKLLVYGALSY
jgi:hypothetical protein